MIFDQGHNDDFYIEYHRISSYSYRDRVRYYDDHKSKLLNLEYSKRLEIDLDYVLCLFEIGKYHRFLSIVDRLIESVIIENVYIFNNENIYNSLLFKKAACLYNTGQFQKSEKILKSISKIDKENREARELFSRCKRKQGRAYYDGLKAIAMVMFISTLTLAILEILIIDPFYHQHLATFSMLKYTCLVTALLSLISNELLLRYNVGKEIGYYFDIESIKDRLGF